MSTPRFYCPNPLPAGHTIQLPENAAVHATRALRLQVGDQVILFNGDGYDYTGILTSVRKQEVSARIEQQQAKENESPLRITLAQAISSGDRMDFTIQKAVEMGVHSIQPISSQRSIVKLSGERADKRREHWQNVAISACEQSGRAYVPSLAAPLSLPQWLASADEFALKLTLDPLAQPSLAQLTAPTGSICLLIGPEGGLSEAEIRLAHDHGYQGVRLGPRILRTETAALATIAAMQALWGDLAS